MRGESTLVRREVLDRMVIFGGRQLVSVLAKYADHYKMHLGGLIHEYAQVA